MELVQCVEPGWANPVLKGRIQAWFSILRRFHLGFHFPERKLFLPGRTQNRTSRAGFSPSLVSRMREKSDHLRKSPIRLLLNHSTSVRLLFSINVHRVRMSLFFKSDPPPRLPTPKLLVFLTVTHQAGSLINSRNIAAGKTTQKQSKANLETDGRRLGAGGRPVISPPHVSISDG